MTAIQAAIMTMAATMDVWRDVAIAILAGIVILCLWVAADELAA